MPFRHKPAQIALQVRRLEPNYRSLYLRELGRTSVQRNSIFKQLLTEISLDIEDLPKNIVASVSAYFEEHSIEEAAMVQYSNGDISYELDLRSAETGEEFEAHFREDGVFIAKGYDL